MSNNLKENQIIAAQLLAIGKTGRDVAMELNVSEETISRWRQEADFQIYQAELTMEAHNVAKARLQNLVSKAVANIEATLSDDNLSVKDRFIISAKVLELCNAYDSTLQEKTKRLRSPFGF